MHAFVIASLAASAAAAVNHMGLPQMKRDIAERQDGMALPTGTCATAALGLLNSLPTPAPAILSDAAANPQTDPCSFTAPASLSAEYSSYESELLSWVTSNEASLSSILGACPELSQYATAIPVCTTALPSGLKATPTGGSGAKETPSSTGSGSSPTHDSGASHQAGAAVLALAVAGAAALAM